MGVEPWALWGLVVLLLWVPVWMGLDPLPLVGVQAQGMGAPTEISRGSDKSSGTKIESSALSDCIRIPLVNKAGSVLWVYL